MAALTTTQRQEMHAAQSKASGWSDDRVERLTTLWREGLSGTQIAAILGGGVSRVAVIAKVHRLGLSRIARAGPSGAGNLRAPAVKAQPRRSHPKPAATANPIFKGDPTTSPLEKRMAVVRANEEARAAVLSQQSTEAPGSATLLTLEAHMCRCPIGDSLRGDLTFCGRRQDGGPYCSHHAKVAYQPRVTTAKRSRAELIHGLRRYI